MPRKKMDDTPQAGKEWEKKDKLELGLQKAREKVAVQNDEVNEDVNRAENTENDDKSADYGTPAFNPLTGDPMTQAAFLFPGKEWTEVTVDAEELSKEIDYIESLKPAQLKSEAFKWFYKSKAMQQWIDEAQRRLKIAQERGDTTVNIPMPVGKDFDTESGMSELMKTLAPLIVMKNMFDEGSKKQGYDLKDLHTVYKEIKDDAMGDTPKKLVKVTDPELGEIEVSPELAMFLKFQSRKGSDTGEQMIMIEEPDGTKRYVPRDIYMFELARQDTRQKDDSKEEETGGTKLVASLLKTIEAQTAALNSLANRINSIERKLEEDPFGIQKFTSFLESFASVKRALKGFFDDGDRDDSKELELEKIRLLGKLAGDDREEVVEKKSDYDVNAVMQRSRQEAEKLLRDIEEGESEGKGDIVEIEEIPIAVPEQKNEVKESE